MNDGSGLSKKGLADLPCVKGVLKTWEFWNVKGVMYLYTLSAILEEACVKVNHTVLQKVQQGVKYRFDILKPVSQCCDKCYVVDL